MTFFSLPKKAGFRNLKLVLPTNAQAATEKHV
jgi:hypothetical protein